LKVTALPAYNITQGIPRGGCPVGFTSCECARACVHACVRVYANQWQNRWILLEE